MIHEFRDVEDYPWAHVDNLLCRNHDRNWGVGKNLERHVAPLLLVLLLSLTLICTDAYPIKCLPYAGQSFNDERFFKLLNIFHNLNNWKWHVHIQPGKWQPYWNMKYLDQSGTQLMTNSEPNLMLAKSALDGYSCRLCYGQMDICNKPPISFEIPNV